MTKKSDQHRTKLTLFTWVNSVCMPIFTVSRKGTAKFCTEKKQRSQLLVKFIKHNQNYYLKRDVLTSIRALHQKKLVLYSSSGSWHNGKTPCQESGHMRGSVGSCPQDNRPWTVMRAATNWASHAYDRFLDTASSRRVKNWKNRVPASSDEGLW